MVSVFIYKRVKIDLFEDFRTSGPILFVLAVPVLSIIDKHFGVGCWVLFFSKPHGLPWLCSDLSPFTLRLFQSLK